MIDKRGQFPREFTVYYCKYMAIFFIILKPGTAKPNVLFYTVNMTKNNQKTNREVIRFCK